MMWNLHLWVSERISAVSPSHYQISFKKETKIGWRGAWGGGYAYVHWQKAARSSWQPSPGRIPARVSICGFAADEYQIKHEQRALYCIVPWT